MGPLWYSLTSNGGKGQYYESHFNRRALELNRRALEFCFDVFEAQSSENTTVFFFLAKKNLTYLKFPFASEHVSLSELNLGATVRLRMHISLAHFNLRHF